VIAETAAPPEATRVSPTASPTAMPVSSAITPTVDLADGIQIDFWHPWTGELADWLEEAASEFNQTNQWGIEVRLAAHADDLVMREDIARAAEDQNLPDVVAAPGASLRQWSQSGIPLQDLNDYVDSAEAGWSQAEVNSFLPIFWKSDLEGEKRLGLPAYRDGHFLFYNRTWAQALGFEAEPQTSQEFHEQACAAADANLRDAIAENNGTGGYVYSTYAISSLSWLTAFAGDAVFNNEEGYDFQAESEQTALEYLFDLYNQDCAWTGKQATPHQYFSDRYALFYSGSSRDIFVQEKSNQEAGSPDEWTLIAYPSDQYRPVVFIDGYSYAILSRDDDQAMAAWLFLRYLLETENQVGLVEATGGLPLSNAAVAALADFRSTHPVWEQALQSLAMAQNVPNDPAWPRVEAAASDLAWQLRFLASRDSIPGLISEAQKILREGIGE